MHKVSEVYRARHNTKYICAICEKPILINQSFFDVKGGVLGTNTGQAHEACFLAESEGA